MFFPEGRTFDRGRGQVRRDVDREAREKGSQKYGGEWGTERGRGNSREKVGRTGTGEESSSFNYEQIVEYISRSWLSAVERVTKGGQGIRYNGEAETGEEGGGKSREEGWKEKRKRQKEGARLGPEGCTPRARATLNSMSL